MSRIYDTGWNRYEEDPHYFLKPTESIEDPIPQSTNSTTPTGTYSLPQIINTDPLPSLFYENDEM